MNKKVSGDTIELSPQDKATLEAARRQFGLVEPHLGRLREALEHLRVNATDDPDVYHRIHKFYKKHPNLRP